MKISKWILRMVAFSVLTSGCIDPKDNPYIVEPSCGCIAPWQGQIRVQEYFDHGHRYLMIGNSYYKDIKIDWYRVRAKADHAPAVYPAPLLSFWANNGELQYPAIQLGTDVPKYSSLVVDAEPIYAGLTPHSGEQIALVDRNHEKGWCATIQESRGPVSHHFSGTTREMDGAASADPILIEQPESISNDSFWVTLHLKADFKFIDFRYSRFQILTASGDDIELTGDVYDQKVTNTQPGQRGCHDKRWVRLRLKQKPVYDYIGDPGLPVWIPFDADLCNLEDSQHQCIDWRNLYRMLFITNPETH